MDMGSNNMKNEAPELEPHAYNLKGLEKPRWEKKMYEYLFERLKIPKEAIAKWKIYVAHPGNDVAITTAFPDADIKFLAPDEGNKQKLESRGFDVAKGDVEVHQGEQANLVIVLDKDVPARHKLLTNIVPGGYLVCHGKMASAVRRMGGYELLGYFDKEKNIEPTLNKGFRESEVTTDEEFKKASDEDSGAVTYEEAREIVEKVFGTRHNVLARYQELVEMAQEQHPGVDGVIDLEFERNGKLISLKDFNTVLPIENNSDRVFAFKKKTV